MSGRLYLVRHFAPTVAEGVCYGQADLAVNRVEHDGMLPGLRAQLPAGVPLYSSPLRRCAQLAGSLGGAVCFDARLSELNFGSWEMRRWEDIARAEIDAWAADVVHYRPGGGDSVHDMALRVASFYGELREQAGRDAVVVCHAGTIRLLAACHRGLAPLAMAQEAAERPHRIAYGEVLVLDCV
jgi:alpha-ribazole phosphatase